MRNYTIYKNEDDDDYYIIEIFNESDMYTVQKFLILQQKFIIIGTFGKFIKCKKYCGEEESK